MKLNRFFTILALCAFALSSCTNSELVEENNGGISLKLLVNGSEGVETKAKMTKNEVLATAKIKIYKADFSGLVRQYVFGEMPEVLYLPADSYRIDVEAGEMTKATPEKASWEQPSWSGSKNVDISANSSSSVAITLKVCNVMSQVKFDESVGRLFNAGYTVKVGTGKDANLTYTAADEGKDGFFIVEGFEPSLIWEFTGKLKDGTPVTKTGTLDAVKEGYRYIIGFKYTETDGLLVFTVVVDDTVTAKNDNISFIATATGIAESSKYEIWAGHFTAHADVDETEYDASKVYFEYREKGASSWTQATATRESEGSFSAVFTGLKPVTEYEYRVMVTPVGEETAIALDAPDSIVTEAAPTIPNGSFEFTSNVESSNYKSLHDPNASDPTLRDKWWDSGNPGSTMLGSGWQICYPQSDIAKGENGSALVSGSQSMCLESRFVASTKFAAGNLFCGHFGETIGTKGGTVYFGRPFTGRPTGLRLWVKYSGGSINRVGDVPSGLVQQGDPDKASLKVALGTWSYTEYGGDRNSPICVNTTEWSTFVDFNEDMAKDNGGTIACGEKIIATGEYKSWTQITIPINYNEKKMKTPTHIVISFAASMYGDYFTGCDSSKLWVDAVELLYE